MLLLSEATGFSVDDAVNSSPWQPGTPPLTLLRLLGIPQSLDSREPSNRRPPPPRLLPRFLPPINLTKTNRSSLSPFFGGFSPPEVGRQPSSGEDALRGSLRVQPVNLTSNASSVSGKPPQVHDSPRMPRLQITPSGRHRWRSADNDVTSSANDVTATTGNTTTDERRHNGDISTTSKTSLSATPPRASHDVNNDSFTSAPEVDNKDDGMHGKNAYDYYSGSDDNETHGKDPFHFAEHGQRLPPVWPPIPRHHMTIYPPPGDQQQQRPFGSASFDVFPGHHPMYGPLPVNTAVGQTLGEVNGQSSDSWTTGGGGAPNNNEALHVLSLAAVNHGDGVRTSTNWELGGRREPAGGLNVEGERTTKTSTSQPGSTSADQTARDTAASPNVASDAGHRPTSGHSCSIFY